jgi:hypothetical protein
MKTYLAASAVALLVGLGSFAQAAQLASPPIPTHPFATNHSNEGTCRIRNVGTKPVTVTVSLFSNNATVPLLDFCQGDGDPRTLTAGQSCYVQVFTPDDSFIGCTVTASSVKDLRGTLELDENFNTTVATDLR